MADAITHGLSAALAIAALVVLEVKAAEYGTVLSVVCVSIFGASLILLYTISTIYHSLSHTGVRGLFQKFDHMAIYILIAGSYTPFALLSIKGALGWTIFGIIWGMAIAGICFKSIWTGKLQILSTIIYVLMGWLVVIALKPLIASTPEVTFKFLFSGGLMYTGGVIFFIWQKLPYSHSIWHLFVSAGSIFHFFAVYGLIS